MSKTLKVHYLVKGDWFGIDMGLQQVPSVLFCIERGIKYRSDEEMNVWYEGRVHFHYEVVDSYWTAYASPHTDGELVIKRLSHKGVDGDDVI